MYVCMVNCYLDEYYTCTGTIFITLPLLKPEAGLVVLHLGGKLTVPPNVIVLIFSTRTQYQYNIAWVTEILNGHDTANMWPVGGNNIKSDLVFILNSQQLVTTHPLLFLRVYHNTFILYYYFWELFIIFYLSQNITS